MKSLVFFSLSIFAIGMIMGNITNNSYAQDDLGVLLKITKHTQEQISNQITIDSSDHIHTLLDSGTYEITALEQSLQNDDVDSAKKHFLSAMKFFTEISRELELSDNLSQTKLDSAKTTVKDPSNDLERLQGYVDNLKIITSNHKVTIDFSEQDELFDKAEQQIANHQFIIAHETLGTIRETLVEVNKKIREESSIQESQRALEYAQKYLEQLDRLIENAKKQDISVEAIEQLEISKQNLASAQIPSEIIKEIRKILLIKDKYALTNNDLLESKILEIEKTLTRLSQVNDIDLDTLFDAENSLQKIKTHVQEGELDVANLQLINLTKQLEEIEYSIP